MVATLSKKPMANTILREKGLTQTSEWPCYAVTPLQLDVIFTAFSIIASAMSKSTAVRAWMRQTA